jgi:hypothetical protein
MQCNESFSTRHTFESVVYDEGVYKTAATLGINVFIGQRWSLPPLATGPSRWGLSFPPLPCCPPTGAGWHRLCASSQIKNWRLFIMFLSGYIFTFVIGVAVGFLFAANMIHSGLDQST